jgi:hypothetical protein
MTGLNPKRAVERCEHLAKLGRIPPWWRVFARRRWIDAYRSIMTLDITEQGDLSEHPFVAAVNRRVGWMGLGPGEEP